MFLKCSQIYAENLDVPVCSWYTTYQGITETSMISVISIQARIAQLVERNLAKDQDPLLKVLKSLRKNRIQQGMFPDLFPELVQKTKRKETMKLEEFIQNPEWQGPVQTEKITEEMLQENPDWTTWGTLPGDLHLFDGTGLEMWIHPTSEGEFSVVGGGE